MRTGDVEGADGKGTVRLYTIAVLAAVAVEYMQ